MNKILDENTNKIGVDLFIDLPAGNICIFTQKSLDNFNNKCLHHTDFIF